MPIRGIKKKRRKKEKKRWRKWQREKGDSGGRTSERERTEGFSPRSPAGCWFSQSVFSPLLACAPIPSFSPKILFRLSSFFPQLHFAPGDLFQVIHTRFSPFPPSPCRRLRRPRAGRGVNLLCISLHRTRLPRLPAANILFHSIISLTVSSPQSDSSLTLFSLRSTALSLETQGAGGYYRRRREAIFRFRV